MTNAEDFLGKIVTVAVDRPFGSKHPRHGFEYPTNYGFVPNTISPDGEELDAYVLGVAEQLTTFTGRCIAVIHRTNDNDDKLIVVHDGVLLTDEEIRASTHFQEQYFESDVLRLPKNHIALYGPPGAGKSTVILYAKKFGWNALDLEDASAIFEERKAVISEFTNGDQPRTLFGAADIPPELFPKGTKFVLLAPDEETLVARVRERNDTRTHKWVEHAKKVRSEHLQMAKDGAFDLVITENLSPEEILEKITNAL